jgi:imidazolonepropionase-like amidohydrolase
MKTWITGVVAALMIATAPHGAQERVLVLDGGTLIDGTGRAPMADAVVVVHGTRITAVGTRGRVTVPPNATVVRLEGRTILPGLIDTHLHLRDYQVPMFLPWGITTIADIHNNTEWSIAQREALEKRKDQGPAPVRVGRAGDGTGRHANRRRQLRRDGGGRTQLRAKSGQSRS